MLTFGNIKDFINLFTKDLVLKKLLEHGLFSEKISTIFSSEAFGKWIADAKYNGYKKRAFSTVTFHLTRNNNVPRIIEIPHPISYYKLCKEIHECWIYIINRIGELDDYTERSMIIPKPNNLNERLFSMVSYENRNNEKLLILDKSFQAKYYVQADIANYYPSIYSHSIPWALVGHQEAKDNRNDEEKWYNKLDIAIRAMQRNETTGIAIGPDTSSVISELILSRIDLKMKDYKYIRYIDDYKCYCDSKEEADTFLRRLSKELERYHLRLNPKKTTIKELPYGLNQNWVRELKSFSIKFLNLKTLTKNQINTVSEFIDLALSLSREYPGESPIRYAVKILSKKEFGDTDIYAFVVMYLSRVCYIFPYFIDLFYDILKKNSPEDQIIEIVNKEINSILLEHLKYSRSDVSLWGIYISLKYKLKIDNFEQYSIDLIKDRDCLPVLLSYYYSKEVNLDLTKYLNLIDEIIVEKIEDEWWIYIYQLYLENHNKSVFNKIKYKDFYEEMRKNNISFLN